MRKYIIYLLKHNMLVQQIYRRVFSFLFHVVGLFVHTDEHLILFNSLMGTRYNDSPRDLYLYITNHQEFSDMQCVWVFEHPEKYPDVPSVKIDTLSFFITALRAKYWISNTNLERGLSFKRKDTKYLYTGHGTAIKLCGNDCPGRKDFNYGSVNYFCIASEFDKMVFLRSFKAHEGCFLKCGRPCNDPLWSAGEVEQQQMKCKLGLPEDKKVILYAPTWRDSEDKGKTYAIRPPINFSCWQEVLGQEYVVLFRAHHITTKILNVQFNKFIRNVTDYPEINDLMIASDILISDYSAVLTDFAILERPIFCFAYDYDEYLKARGTYFELDDELPNKSCRTEQELLNRIMRIDVAAECKNTKKFKSKFDQYGGRGLETSVQILFADRLPTKDKAFSD